MHKTSHPTAILLFGPTASGKTSLAIELAKKFNGEIINADSRQIYKQMPIITAMPTEQEFAQVKHHLFNFLEPNAEFSVADYLALANKKAQEINKQGKMPIFVGGTGLYLKALEFGLADIPNIKEDLFLELNNTKTEDLYKELQNIDSIMAEKLDCNDTQRIIRSLGIIKQTGKSLHSWQQEPNKNMLDYNFIHLAINPERETMYQRINTRAAKMLDLGVINEVKSVVNTYTEEKLNSLTSIGFDIFLDLLHNNINETQAAEKFAQKQRNYAKRQITWLKHQYPTDYIHNNLEQTIEYLKKQLECQQN